MLGGASRETSVDELGEVLLVESMASTDDLARALTIATRFAVTALFRERANERSYYCALITTGEALATQLTAWSLEALETVANGDPIALAELKCFYTDCPYCGYCEQYA